MERLTHKARYEAGYKLNKGVKEWQAADRLGAYENTGLTPEQIRELKERDTAMEINEIHVDEYPIPLCECEGSYKTEIYVIGNSIDNQELLEVKK